MYIFIKNLLKAILPPEAINLARTMRRKLRLSPVQRVFKGLERRKIRLKDLNALEVFGGCGNLHTIDYAAQVSTLEVWEIEQKCEAAIRRNLPMAKVKITDSYKEIKKTLQKYNLIMIDNPISTYGNHCEHFDLFPDIFRVAMDSTVLIFNVIPEIDDTASKRYPHLGNKVQLERRKSFYKTNHPEKISFDKLVEVYRNLIETNGFNLEWYFFQKSSFYLCYYLVLKINKNRGFPDVSLPKIHNLLKLEGKRRELRNRG